MISKYSGTCYLCGKATRANVDHYDLDTRKSYHEACKIEADSRQPTLEELAEQHALAERLGFRTPADWNVLLLPSAANGDPAWWDRPSTRERDSLWPVPTSDTATINDKSRRRRVLMCRIEVKFLDGKTKTYECESFSTDNGELEIVKPGPDKPTVTIAPGHWVSVEEF